MNRLTEYDFDAGALFRALDRWFKRHRGDKECEVIPVWAYGPGGVECSVELRAGSSCESIWVARTSEYRRGSFDFPYLRPKRHGAEALAYAWIVAAYLEEKGLRVRLRPTVDALAKLQSFILLPEGQIVMN